MFELFQNLRWMHIAAGSLALLLFWIPALARKGGALHVRAGWAYAACMSVVVLTAFGMSGMVFAWPLAVRSLSQRLSATESAAFLRASRQMAFFLAYLGGVTLAAGWQGIGVLRMRRNAEAFRNPFTYGLNGAVLLAAVGSLSMGIWQRNGIFIGMSTVGFLVGGGNSVYLLRRSADPMAWWYEHLTSMFATGIAGYTAFLVFGGAHLFGASARTKFYALFWFLPTVIGTVAITLCNVYYRRTFGGKKPRGRSLKPEMKIAF